MGLNWTHNLWTNKPTYPPTSFNSSLPYTPKCTFTLHLLSLDIVEGEIYIKDVTKLRARFSLFSWFDISCGRIDSHQRCD